MTVLNRKSSWTIVCASMLASCTGTTDVRDDLGGPGDAYALEASNVDAIASDAVGDDVVLDLDASVQPADATPSDDTATISDATNTGDTFASVDDVTQVDGSAVVDSNASAGDGSASNICPEPAVLTAAQLPVGYLPGVAVQLSRSIDGDTADFYFPGGNVQTVRFLFVNTEESFGAQMTAFGLAAKARVAQYLTAAREIVVAPRDSWRMPGTPNLDPYGRWLSLVFVDGDLIQTRLIREGWSPYYTLFGCADEPVHSALVHAEAEANFADVGVWAPRHPTDYRTILAEWVAGGRGCRPDPFVEPYCP